MGYGWMFEIGEDKELVPARASTNMTTTAKTTTSWHLKRQQQQTEPRRYVEY
jgi:hypothetical protein